MSFSMSVKNEAAKVSVREGYLVEAELCGLINTCGSISIAQGRLVVSLSTENAPVARRIFTHLKSFYSDDVNASARKNVKLKRNIYTISLSDDAAIRKLLNFCYGEGDFSIYNEISPDLSDSKSKQAFVRGCFLGAGSVTNPRRGYHFEVVFSNRDAADILKNILNEYQISGNIIERSDKFIFYIKGAEMISDTLTVIGANRSVLEFENVRAMKETRNNVNRMVNCETANLEKIVNSSIEQVNDIMYIDSMIGLESLPDSLYELAKLRLVNRNASLKDLGELLNPKVGKSGVNHRMKKIRNIADDLRGEYDGD